MTEPSLEDLDAVGPARADLLRKYGFETVESLVEATPAKLVEIDGIDEATATDILASVVRVLDRSKPTVDTPRSKLASPTFSPFRPLPFTPPTIDRSERRWNAGWTSTSGGSGNAVRRAESRGGTLGYQ